MRSEPGRVVAVVHSTPEGLPGDDTLKTFPIHCASIARAGFSGLSSMPSERQSDLRSGIFAPSIPSEGETGPALSRAERAWS